ncbi:TPA: hypothetical protein LU109_003586 [Enterobacter hormaechei subsp. xiangfangensis]|nr:hypothetical protein [Enterobacter hormaechei subsp. xiangfangensis]
MFERDENDPHVAGYQLDTLVFSPMILMLFGFMSTPAHRLLHVALGLVLVGYCFYQDRYLLRQSGYVRVPSAFWFLCLPVYLWKRDTLTGNTLHYHILFFGISLVTAAGLWFAFAFYL